MEFTVLHIFKICFYLCRINVAIMRHLYIASYNYEAVATSRLIEVTVLHPGGKLCALSANLEIAVWHRP